MGRGRNGRKEERGGEGRGKKDRRGGRAGNGEGLRHGCWGIDGRPWFNFVSLYVKRYVTSLSTNCNVTIRVNCFSVQRGSPMESCPLK